MDSPHKGQWRETLMFSLICAWTNGWANDRHAGGLKRHRAHYDVPVMASSGLNRFTPYALLHCLQSTYWSAIYCRRGWQLKFTPTGNKHLFVFYLVKIIPGDVLSTAGSRAWSGMLLTELDRIYSLQHKGKLVVMILNIPKDSQVSTIIQHDTSVITDLLIMWHLPVWFITIVVRYFVDAIDSHREMISSRPR